MPADAVLAGFAPVVRPRVKVIPRLERLGLADIYREADIRRSSRKSSGCSLTPVCVSGSEKPRVTSPRTTESPPR